MNYLNFLQGKKTILTGLVMLIYAVAGIVLGNLDQNTAIEIGGTGLAFIFLRLGIK